MNAISEINKHFGSVSESRAAAQDAQRREDDHGPALAMNAEYDRARLQALADQNLVDKRAAADVHRITGVAMPALPYAEMSALTDAAVDDLWPTDTDIVDAVVEAFNMSRSEVIDRLTKFDAAALRELEAA